jgi:hypothetical protein
MGLPPKHKDLTSDIISFIKLLVRLALAGILVSIGLPALFLLLHVLSWPPSTKKEREVKQNIVMVNALQFATINDRGVFAKTFDELATGTLRGGNTTSSQVFEYKLDIQSQDLAIIGAKPLDKEKHGLNGAVLRYKNRRGFLSNRSIICESAIEGADGTERINLPVINNLGKLSCAPNWKVLEENNSEPSDGELVKLIQDKTDEEIKRILREQDSIYYMKGKFADQYSDIPQENNKSPLKFNVKIRSQENRAIVTVQDTSPDRDKYKTSFGVIKVVRAKPAQALSNSDRDKNRVFWHYLDTISFLCTSNRPGTPLPNNRQLDRVVNNCPSGYIKNSGYDKRPERENKFILVRHNLVTIRMLQEAYYKQHRKFMTDFNEFEKFALANSGNYSDFIKVKQDPYHYNFRANGKQLVITAQPKSFIKSPSLSNVTYLRISSATGTSEHWPHLYTYCQSNKPNIPIPTDEEISKIGLSQERHAFYLENCPAGYTLIKDLE